MARKKNIEQTDDNILTEQLTKLTEDVAVLYAVIEKHNTELSALVDQKKAIEEEIDRRRIASTSGHDWSFLLEETGSSSTERYKAANAALEGLMPYEVYGISVFGASGYYPATNQRALKIALVKGNSAITNDATSVLNMLLEFITPVDDGETEHERPYKRVGVFESTCSQYGSYWLAINQEHGQFELYRTAWHRASLVHAAATLRELLGYVEYHHPYRACDANGVLISPEDD